MLVRIYADDAHRIAEAYDLKQVMGLEKRPGPSRRYGTVSLRMSP